MKFEYETKVDDHEVVAFTFALSGDDDRVGLCIREDDGKAVWLYHDGAVRCNGSFKENLEDPEHNLQKFYKGDKITITF